MPKLALAWRDALVASDPGRIGLRMGLRATVAAALITAVLALLGHLLHVPVTAGIAGIMMGMMGAAIVNDPTPRRQAVTLALVAPCSGIALALGTLLAPDHRIAALVLLAVTFASVYLRRYGLRWTTLGLMAFFGYFFAVFLHLTAKSLLPVLGGIGVGVALAFLVRFALIRESPERVLESTVAGFRARVALNLDAFARFLERPGLRTLRTARRQLEALNDAALDLEERLDPSHPDAAMELRTRVFELELSVESLATAVRAMQGAPEPRRLQAASELRAARAHLGRDYAPAEGALTRQLGELFDAAAALRSAPRVPARHLPEPPRARGSGLDPQLRLALQATLATALAYVVGTAISPVRWYWAVIGAFVVFNRTTTVAETWVRAANRVLGTIAGVVAGLGVAELLRGHPRLELVGIFAFIFLAYWLFRVSYAWLVLWITALLAVFYELLGMLTPGLLLLRLEETLAGCACGVLAAAVLIPSHTRDKVRARAADVLETLAAGLGRMEVAARENRRADLVDLARELDREVRALREAAQPLTGRLVRWGPTAMTRPLHAVLALAYYARLLGSEPAADTDCPALHHVADAARALARTLREHTPPPAVVVEPEPGCSRHLSRMGQLLGELAAELG